MACHEFGFARAIPTGTGELCSAMPIVDVGLIEQDGQCRRGLTSMDTVTGPAYLTYSTRKPYGWLAG